LRFVTLEGDPSRAANDGAIRKLVKSNAYRSRKALAGIQATPNQTDSSSVPILKIDLVAGKSRFALSSRKPLKRVRRQAASYSGCKSNDEYLEVETKSVLTETTVNSVANFNVPGDAYHASHGYSRRIRCQPQYSPASPTVITKLKIQTTAPFFTSDESTDTVIVNLHPVIGQALDMQHLFYDLVGLA
jgi:hypothetical protein